jgi:hypothetical protein
MTGKGPSDTRRHQKLRKRQEKLEKEATEDAETRATEQANQTRVLLLARPMPTGYPTWTAASSLLQGMAQPS